VKEFLSQRDIPFIERDIAADEQAMDELTALGYFTTPVVRIDDEIVVGFDRARLESLLE
jgi:glutaredoxin